VRRCSLLLGGALLALSGCGQEVDPRASTLSRERFVAVNVALRTARFPQPPVPGTAADSAKARADSARIRSRILQREKVTPAELQAFVDARRDDTEELAEIWGEIADRVAKADSARRAPAAGAPPGGPPPAGPPPPTGRPAHPPVEAPSGPPRGMPDPGGPPPGALPPPGERRP
jgi:hypothetical protein